MKKELSDVQMAVMRVFWARGEATVADVHATLEEAHGFAPTTVATLIKRLEKYGFLDHRKEGRTFVYRPIVSESEIQQSMVSRLINRIFRGKSSALVAHLLRDSEIADDELDEIQSLIDAHKESEE